MNFRLAKKLIETIAKGVDPSSFQYICAPSNHPAYRRYEKQRLQQYRAVLRIPTALGNRVFTALKYTGAGFTAFQASVRRRVDFEKTEPLVHAPWRAPYYIGSDRDFRTRRDTRVETGPLRIR